MVTEGCATTYESAVLEQYRLYVEMADRVSARRGLTNSFFLTLNTGIFTLVAAFGKTAPGDKGWWLAIPLAAILGECFAWFYLVRSYRLLNSAKYQVVGALEERLPASPFWRAECGPWAKEHTERGTGPSPTSSSGSLSSSGAYISGFLAIVLA
jgi:hypothetical protein